MVFSNSPNPQGLAGVSHSFRFVLMWYVCFYIDAYCNQVFQGDLELLASSGRRGTWRKKRRRLKKRHEERRRTGKRIRIKIGTKRENRENSLSSHALLKSRVNPRRETRTPKIVFTLAPFINSTYTGITHNTSIVKKT